MIHDETTTEFELPKLKSPSSDDNIVRVKFTERRKEPVKRTHINNPPAKAIAKSNSFLNWMKEVDLSAPWLIRLLAVLAILVLSMLVL